MEPMDIVGRTKEDASLPKERCAIHQILSSVDFKVLTMITVSGAAVCLFSVAGDLVKFLFPFLCLFYLVGIARHRPWRIGYDCCSIIVATMTKIIKEMLPPDVRVARDAQDLLIECCVEFINLISSESNEVCNREDKRTIAPEHVLKALEVLGFGEYIEEVYAAYEQHRLETMDTMRSGKWSNGAEMTEEEALAEQQRMFAEARARMNGGASAPKPSDPQAQSNSNS
ncbi:protein dr1 homolog [Phtheirospermum japonicum]|uniref:Protein dr1 homolog n=1 Tax=Phtheirospermum japonicum TaxID=374723 RepID=A0A830BHB2_9LAMI|nr:protein dr1 homolog [Phtheirospermum japonicum]